MGGYRGQGWTLQGMNDAGAARPNADEQEEAEAAGAIFELDAEDIRWLQAGPYRGSLSQMVPTDPLIYRFTRSSRFTGRRSRCIEEDFGDDIMSAIDFTMDIRREPDPKGTGWSSRSTANFCLTRSTWAPAKPRPDETLIRTLARVRRGEPFSTASALLELSVGLVSQALSLSRAVLNSQFGIRPSESPEKGGLIWVRKNIGRPPLFLAPIVPRSSVSKKFFTR